MMELIRRIVAERLAAARALIEKYNQTRQPSADGTDTEAGV